IGRAIEKLAHSHAFSVVREYQGHGIGRRFHQDPSVLHYPHPRHEHIQLKPGYCFTVEPMINEGTWKTALDRKDGWTVRTTDGLLSAQFEHTVLVTDDPDHPLEVLTLTKDGPAEGHRF
ncbi:MAG: M24 family metallopeptidase, partial [Planctomycetota bacterium]